MEKKLTRSNFLHIVNQVFLWISAALGVGILVKYLNYKPAPPPPRRFEIGPETDYPPGSRTVLSEIPAVLINDEHGLHALSLVCTHLGCTVEMLVTTGSFQCQCHGSRFDREGGVVRGPATEPLPQLILERNPDGTLVVVK